MTRTMDELGRVVLPMEYRQALNIAQKNEVDISLDGDTIIISKRIPSCRFCQSTVTLVQIGKDYVCRACI